MNNNNTRIYKITRPNCKVNDSFPNSKTTDVIWVIVILKVRFGYSLGARAGICQIFSFVKKIILKLSDI